MLRSPQWVELNQWFCSVPAATSSMEYDDAVDSVGDNFTVRGPSRVFVSVD
jgi:hypothetical protein